MMVLRTMLWMILLAGGVTRAADVTPATPRAVVVELFTSEGCSSCPPAEQQLAMNAKQPPVAGVTIIPLAWHVDYFNDPWVDPFSSRQWTARQSEYGQRFGVNIYTPQMVVDGTSEFVGGEKKSFNEAIARAAESPKGVATITLSDHDGGKSLRADVAASALPKISDGDVAEVFLIVTEDGFRVPIKRGENGGSTLRHDGVVRYARKIGAIDPATPDRFAGAASALLDASWKRGRLHVVVLVQEQRSGRILAAAMSAVAELK